MSIKSANFSSKFSKENFFVGRIELSKGMAFALRKKAAEKDVNGVLLKDRIILSKKVYVKY